MPKALPHPIAFNVFSHKTAIGPEGYNGEEMKIMMGVQSGCADELVRGS